MTESAGVIAPLLLIASTIGIETNPVPAITTAVAALVITEGVNEEIVGLVSVHLSFLIRLEQSLEN